jgi:hypothetical protein
VRTLKHLFVIGVPLIGIPALFAPFVVPFIFGEVWAEAGWYCWPLAAMTVAQFAVAGIGFLSLYGYNHWTLMWNITRVVGVIGAFYLSYLFTLPVIMALIIYVLVMVGMYILSVILNLKAISNFTLKIAQ